LAKGISWFDAAPSILRRIKELGQGYAKRDSTDEKPLEMTGFAWDLGEDHPIYHIVPHKAPLKLDPYAYYIRIPDLPGFLNLISPVLEDRLSKSYMVGHTGELKLNFFKSGIEMVFEKGKVKLIQPWEKPTEREASAHFPDLTFIQLLLGYRDVTQLEDAFPDLYYPKDGAKYLLGALFPRKPSKVMALG
jgi:hypothetical protein